MLQKTFYQAAMVKILSFGTRSDRFQQISFPYFSTLFEQASGKPIFVSRLSVPCFRVIDLLVGWFGCVATKLIQAYMK